MPIYLYQCVKCKKEIEILQKISDPAPEKCEECGGEMKKLIAKSSFILKGSGWYVTDYKNKPKSTPKAPT